MILGERCFAAFVISIAEEVLTKKLRVPTIDLYSRNLYFNNTSTITFSRTRTAKLPLVGIKNLYNNKQYIQYF